jgi:NADH:ubiquinone oxidoreductase subunit 5 (subunit L)/multisubunit Na+/H+ antiporter MnhA subunit
VGSLTALLSSLIGVLQFDIKKIIAYSTCSQLGYMFMSCGLSSYHLSFYHLFNHAFFKALLFLCAGSIIHIFSNYQDMRVLNGLLFISPVTYVTFFFGLISLTGVPFFSAYYSKDLIIETNYIVSITLNFFVL